MEEAAVKVRRILCGLADPPAIRARGRAGLSELVQSVPELAERLADAHAAYVVDGAVVLEGVPVDRDDVLLVLCSFFGRVTRHDNGPPPGHLIRDLIWSPADGVKPELRLHTDSAYSPDPHTAIALACAHNADSGWGDSLLATIADVTDRLTGMEIESLATVAVSFVKTGAGRAEQQYEAAVLGRSEHGVTCRLNLDHLTTGEQYDGAFTMALNRVVELLTAAALRIPLATGDLLVIDNRRVLHGRTALGGRSVRRLRRVKMVTEAA